MHRSPDRQKARWQPRRAACPRLRTGRLRRHRKPAGRPQRQLQRQARQGLGLFPRRVRRLPAERLAEAVPGRRKGLYRLQPRGRGAPAEADGRVQPVHRRPHPVCPLPARHDRIPGDRPAAPQRRRGGERRARRDAFAPPRPWPAAPGGAHQPVGVEEQPELQTVHFVHQGQERQEGLGLLPRLHRLPGGRRRPGRNPHPAQGLQ
ncbi:hypothetical protein D3C79_804820 [compost metagenome]